MVPLIKCGGRLTKERWKYPSRAFVPLNCGCRAWVGPSRVNITTHRTARVTAHRTAGAQVVRFEFKRRGRGSHSHTVVRALLVARQVPRGFLLTIIHIVPMARLHTEYHLQTEATMSFLKTYVRFKTSAAGRHSRDRQTLIV